MLATSAVDKTVTLWDTSNGETPRAKMNKDMKVGKLFTLNFYPSSPWLLGCGGGGKEIAIWDMREDTTVQKCFGGRAIATSGPASESSPQKESTESIIDSVMASNTTAVEKKTSSATKKKKKKKKKVHRAGR